ncbi:unnamed protein product [Rangifer tarandus platyrhynchus]|uniref:Uncharacterized protein n=3 Tax=Rangifer tarandus platyrhynchus TaxID=3082113 RepID=A0ACB0F186_RANTA|nr:unnamed protein product [Rangifer tarandus platyrhynchus]CAI9706594.1 unnamed protein product [Rangifer tarandus platyrhynchus]
MGPLPIRRPGIPRPPPPSSRRRNPHLTVPASHLWPAEDYARRSGDRVGFILIGCERHDAAAFPAAWEARVPGVPPLPPAWGSPGPDTEGSLKGTTFISPSGLRKKRDIESEGV